MPFELPEILGEHAPDRLQQEVPQHVGTGRAAVAEDAEQYGDERYGLARHRRLGSDEHRLALGEEHQRVDAIGELQQIELGARLVGEGPRLPDLEAPERAQHDEPRCGNVAARIGSVAPVVQGLRPM